VPLGDIARKEARRACDKDGFMSPFSRGTYQAAIHRGSLVVAATRDKRLI